jgi:hypothetical protein
MKTGFVYGTWNNRIQEGKIDGPKRWMFFMEAGQLCLIIKI